MNKKVHELLVRTITALGMAVIFLGSYFYSPYSFNAFLFLIISWVLWFEWPPLCPGKGIEKVLFTLVYPITPLLALVWIHHQYREINQFIPLYPFILAGAYDTVAYLVGTFFGTHKIWPSISPNKSWEGLLGGGIALTGVFYCIHPIMAWNVFILKAVLFTAAAFFGDLFESYLKRKKGIKDAANILPGHGGVLDRIDAVLGVTILFLFCW